MTEATTTLTRADTSPHALFNSLDLPSNYLLTPMQNIGFYSINKSLCLWQAIKNQYTTRTIGQIYPIIFIYKHNKADMTRLQLCDNRANLFSINNIDRHVFPVFGS